MTLLTELLQEYAKVLRDKYHCLSDWVFPARETDKCLSVGTIDKKCRDFWALTPFAESCDKAPVIRARMKHSIIIIRLLKHSVSSGIKMKLEDM